MLTALVASAIFAQKTVLAFPGGSSSDLCHMMQEQLKKPVACLVYDEKPIKAFNLNWYEQKDFDRLMWPVGKHHLVRAENGVGLYRGGWTINIIDQDPSYLSKIKPFKIPNGTSKGGKITLETDSGTAIALGSLSRLDLTKPLDIHWFYQELAVAVSAKGATEKQFLSAIAAAVGAEYKETKDEYRFEFDPKNYRTRLLENLSGPRPVGYKEYKWGERYSEAVTGLLIEAARALTDAQLEKAFKHANDSVTIDAPKGTALYRAGMKKLDAVEEASQERHPDFRQVADVFVIQLGKIDLSKPIKVAFGPLANCGVMFRSLENPNIWIAL